MARKLVFFISIICSWAAHSQVFTLAQCLDKAVAQHPEVQSAQIGLARAQNQIQSAKSNMLPQMGVGLFQGGNFGRSIDKFTNDYIDQFYSTTFGNVSVGMPIFTGFQNKYRVEASKQAELAAQEWLQASKNRIKRTVIAAFMNSLSSKELSALAQKQLERSSLQINLAQKKYEAGTISRLELMQLQSQGAIDEMNALDAQAAQKTAMLSLFQSMNEPYHEGMDIVFEPALATELAQKSVDEILEQQPEYRQYRFMTESANYSIKAEQAAKYPRLSLGADYGLFYASTNKERNFGQQLNDTRNGSISLNLRIPIAAGLQAKPLIEAQRIQQMSHENSFKTNSLLLRNQIENSLLQYQIARQRFSKAQELRNMALQSGEFIGQQFQTGMVSIESLLLAKNNLERTEINLVQAKYRLYQEIEILNYFYGSNFN